MSDKHSLSILNDSIFERSGESTSSSLAPPLQEDGMSEKVQNMADSVYREFERMIAQYGEGVSGGCCVVCLPYMMLCSG